jgi:hypothetical protein
MVGQNLSNLIMIVFVVIVIFGIIKFLDYSDEPLPNEGKLSDQIAQTNRNVNNVNNQLPLVTQTNGVKNKDADKMVDDFVRNFQINERPIDRASSFEPVDPFASEDGQFTGLPQKKQIDLRKIDNPFTTSPSDQTFVFKKKNFVLKNQDSVKDMFDSQKLLPNEINNDWFDVAPLQTTKKIKGTHLLHPKTHFGVNTVGSSLRNALLDIRGNIPVPKINVGPWNQSTIEPDTNLMGLSNPV